MSDPTMAAALRAAREALDPTLLPCPHCAGQIIKPRHYGMDFTGPVTIVWETPQAGLSKGTWGIRCFNPGCGAGTSLGATAEEAAERWNRRAP